MILFSCTSVSDSVKIEQKLDKTYELHLDSFPVFMNNGEYVFYSELIYKYPEDFFYWKIYPDNRKLTFQINKISLLIEKNVINLQTFILKEPKPLFQVKDMKTGLVKQNIEHKIMKLDYNDFKQLTDENLSSQVIINSKINDKDEELKFLVEAYDKKYLQKYDKDINTFKKERNKKKENR